MGAMHTTHARTRHTFPCSGGIVAPGCARLGLQTRWSVSGLAGTPRCTARLHARTSRLVNQAARTGFSCQPDPSRCSTACQERAECAPLAPRRSGRPAWRRQSGPTMAVSRKQKQLWPAQASMRRVRTVTSARPYASRCGASASPRSSARRQQLFSFWLTTLMAR